MATPRIINFIRLANRKHLITCSVPITSLRSNLHFPLFVPQATYAEQKSLSKSEQNESNSQIQVGFAEVVKENTKSAWYLTVIIAGVGVTSIMFYAIFRELFSSKSPNSVYSKALDRCMQDPKIQDSLGLPIKAYGEETRRGRRGHVGHTVYQTENGVKRMRMKFYIQGPRKQGTVNLEMREDENGSWVYRYLFVQCQDRARSVIILEDNRESENVIFKTPEELHELTPPGYKL